MKKLLALAAVLEAATGLALIVAPSLVWATLIRRGNYRRRHTGSPRTGHRLDRIRGRLLARPGIARHVNLRRPRHGVFPVSRFRRRMGWAFPVAGSRVACVLTLLLACAWFKSRENDESDQSLDRFGAYRRLPARLLPLIGERCNRFNDRAVTLSPSALKSSIMHLTGGATQLCVFKRVR